MLWGREKGKVPPPIRGKFISSGRRIGLLVFGMESATSPPHTHPSPGEACLPGLGPAVGRETGQGEGKEVERHQNRKGFVNHTRFYPEDTGLGVTEGLMR